MKHLSNYGIDAPYVIKKLIATGIFVSIFYSIVFYLLYIYYPNSNFLVVIFCTMFATPISMFATATLMLWSSKFGKLRQADRLLNQIPWRGNEHVLDVGCGSGLLLNKAAKKLTLGGAAVGIDIWSKIDLSDNSAQVTINNARIEGVLDRIKIVDGDARELPFADASFDIVVSSLVVHNLAQKYNRESVMNEMIRVLKPGGYLLIQDIFYTKEYAIYLKTKNLSSVMMSSLQWLIFPPVRMVIAKK